MDIKCYKHVFRQKQSEAREQRDKLQLELDPGNPNWEFLKMIR